MIVSKEKKDHYKKLSQPPKWALKEIAGGRLKGKTDINPQWRYEAMTEVYGECGTGWNYEINDLWTLPGANGEIAAFAKVNVYIKDGDGWSKPIPGVGGSMLVTKEKSGLNTSDEAYKMAVTDALSVALKMLGVGADVYKGLWDGSKYRELAAECKEDKPLELFKKLVTGMADADERIKQFSEADTERRREIYGAAQKAIKESKNKDAA